MIRRGPKDSRIFLGGGITIQSGQGGSNPHAAYIATVLGVQNANLIALWPGDELSGTAADNAQGTAARDGTFSGVTLNSSTGPFGGPTGLWDGVDDFLNVYSASLNTAFSGAAGTMQVWFKVSGAGVWTDATLRGVFTIQVNSSNRARIVRSATNNRIAFFYSAGGTNEIINVDTFSGNVAWNHAVITWSAASDRVRGYINGAQVGTDQTVLGVWAGALNTLQCNVGATAATTERFSGYCALPALWSIELTAAEVSALYNGGPIA